MLHTHKMLIGGIMFFLTKNLPLGHKKKGCESYNIFGGNTNPKSLYFEEKINKVYFGGQCLKSLDLD